MFIHSGTHCSQYYLAKEGHQVMFTQGKYLNVLDDHHLVMVFVKDSVI